MLNMKAKKIKKNIANRMSYRHDIWRLLWKTNKRLTIFYSGRDREGISCSDKKFVVVDVYFSLIKIEKGHTFVYAKKEDVEMFT